MLNIIPLLCIIVLRNKSLLKLFFTGYRNDGIFGSGVPGAICRPLRILDDPDADPDCRDVTLCPIKMFREHRILHFTIPRDHPDLIDIQRYRVGQIHVDVIGAKADEGAPNNRLKLMIESSSPFSVRRGSLWYDFLSRALQVVHEYDVVNGMFLVDIAKEYSCLALYIDIWQQVEAGAEDMCLVFIIQGYVDSFFLRNFVICLELIYKNKQCKKCHDSGLIKGMGMLTDFF